MVRLERDGSPIRGDGSLELSSLLVEDTQIVQGLDMVGCCPQHLFIGLLGFIQAPQLLQGIAKIDASINVAGVQSKGLKIESDGIFCFAGPLSNDPGIEPVEGIDAVEAAGFRQQSKRLIQTAEPIVQHAEIMSGFGMIGRHVERGAVQLFRFLKLSGLMRSLGLVNERSDRKGAGTVLLGLLFFLLSALGAVHASGLRRV